MKKLISFYSYSILKFKDNRIRSFFYVLAAALIGLIFYLPVIPNMIPAQALTRFPMSIIMILVVLQSIIFIALLAAAGAYLAPRVGFRAPLCDVHINQQTFRSVLKEQCLIAIPVGLAGAIIACLVAPEFISYVNKTPPLPRLFYGGLTEEVAARWGIMTIIVWILWRIFQKGNGTPTNILVCSGILLSQTIFALGHIPALNMAGVGNVSWSIVTIFFVSILWGWLFWKRGLEAAMIAHASFHAFIAIFTAVNR